MEPNATNGPAGIDDIAGAHSPPVPLIRLPASLNHEWFQILLVVVLAPAIYYLLLQLGRRLKRGQGVQLGISYHLFCLGFAIFLPAVLLRPDWMMVHHVGAATVIFGGVF